MTARNILAGLMLLASTTAFAQTGTQPPQQPPAKPEEPPVYEEQVVVTASKVEQQLVNAPATVSVVTADVIASTPATNYAELFRSVPGVNIAQTSARDFNITMRGATSTLATSTLALLDGRSIYLDFFGFVAWDLLPVNPNELKQVEVVRGPGSAVWGANAMNGVVNFISKTPRELNGNSATIQFGAMNRDVEGGQQPGPGSPLGLTAPLVGRVEELDQLRSAFERMQRGQAQVVSLIGEAGTGKSRLIAELLSRLAAEGQLADTVVRQATCASLGEPTYGVFATRRTADMEESMAINHYSMTLEKDFYEQDNRALSGIHFRAGMLLKRDETLAKFLDHLKRQPRAHPSRDAIR